MDVTALADLLRDTARGAREHGNNPDQAAAAAERYMAEVGHISIQPLRLCYRRIPGNAGTAA